MVTNCMPNLRSGTTNLQAAAPWLSLVFVFVASVTADAGAGNASLHEADADHEAGRAFSLPMARALAALASLTYCASDWKGVPPGLATAVERNCGDFCEEAGLAVERGTVRLVDLPDAGSRHQLFAISGRLANLRAGAAPAGCFLAIRGPIGLPTDPSWARDRDSALVSLGARGCPECHVHRGYKGAWDRMANLTVSELRANGCKAESKSSLYITGHSMGGAVGLLAMYALQAEGYDVQLSYTFAAPKVGNRHFAVAFARAFKRPVPVFRVTRAGDWVPAMPTDPRYKDVPFQVHYFSDGLEDYTICYDAADTSCGTAEDGGSQLPTTDGQHSALALVPYGCLTQLRPLGPFVVTPAGQEAYSAVCINGGRMRRAPGDRGGRGKA